MHYKMHHDQRIQPRPQIVENDPRAFRNAFQLPHRRWLQDVENTKEYKARQESFPRDWDANETNQLASDFVDHYKLRILQAGCARYARGGRDSNEHSYEGQNTCCCRLRGRRNRMRHNRPEQDRGRGAPTARSGPQAAHAEKGGNHGGPEWGRGDPSGTAAFADIETGCPVASGHHSWARRTL